MPAKRKRQMGNRNAQKQADAMERDRKARNKAGKKKKAGKKGGITYWPK